MTPNKLLTATLFTALFSAVSARATVVQSVSFDDKVGNADAIVLGTCTTTRAEWDPSHRWILTYASFQVEQSVKGAPARELTVVTPGGSLDGIHQSSVGITPFDKGDERVLFVKNTRMGPTVLYFDQGTYDVSNDAHGERVITPIASDAVVRMDNQRGSVVVEQPRTLRDFVGAVHESERRAAVMAMVKRQRQPVETKEPISSVLSGYWFLIALAFAGASLATWKFMRK